MTHDTRAALSKTTPSRIALALGLLSLAAPLVPACLYDSSDVCGPRQHEGTTGACVCDAGYAADASGICRKQVADPAALGAACDADTPCDDPKYSQCHAASDTSGYCTNVDCDSDDDCDGDYTCDDAAEPSYCRRPPTGQGEPCASDDDCKDFEADYCLVNPVMSACLVAGCTADADCTPGWTCEDYSGALPGTPPVCVTMNP